MGHHMHLNNEIISLLSLNHLVINLELNQLINLAF